MSNKRLHQKIAMLLLLIIVGTANIAQAEQEATASWSCFDYSEETKPIIKAWAYEEFELGKIKASGIVKDANYSKEGLTHRWDFDLNPDGTYDAAFRIQPDGTGYYYYFGNKETGKPNLITKCKKTK